MEVVRLDLSRHFAFPGARDIILFILSGAGTLNSHAYDIVDESIGSHGFEDRLKIVEYGNITNEGRSLFVQLNTVALLGQDEISEVARRNESIKSFLRRFFASHFPLRILNPYVFRGPVTGRQFFGRDEEIAAVRSQVQKSFVISGARRSGKTSLLLEIKRRIDLQAEPDELIVYITFENCNALADIPRSVLLGLTEAGGDFVRLANSSRWQHPQNLSLLVGVIVKFLKRQQRDFRIVRLFLDEYDKVLSLERANSKSRIGLSGVLREVMVERKKVDGKRGASGLSVQFAFSGSPILYEELVSPGAPLFNFAHKLHLRNFELRTLTSLLTVPLRDLGLKVSDAQLLAQKLLEISGGHPSTAQHLCAVMVDYYSVEALGDREVSVEDLERASQEYEFLEELAETIERNFSSLGRFVLAIIAKSRRELFDPTYFSRAGEAYGVRLLRTATTTELSALADSGYLKPMRSERPVDYRLAIPTIKRLYADVDPNELVPDMLADGLCSRNV